MNLFELMIFKNIYVCIDIHTYVYMFLYVHMHVYECSVYNCVVKELDNTVIVWSKFNITNEWTHEHHVAVDVISWERHIVTHVVYWQKIHNLNLVMGKHQTNPKWGTFYFNKMEEGKRLCSLKMSML